MIITRGGLVKVESGEYVFERSAEAPGIITVRSTKGGGSIVLYAHADRMDHFIEAYSTIAGEPVAYRTTEQK